MNYFFPRIDNAAKADHLWRGTRRMLAANGFPSEPRRIHALFFERAGERRVYQVGVEDGDTGELVLLIYRARGLPLYWVCTFGNGLLEGAPIPVPAGRGTREVAFGPKRDEPKRAKPKPARARRRRA